VSLIQFRPGSQRKYFRINLAGFAASGSPSCCPTNSFKSRLASSPWDLTLVHEAVNILSGYLNKTVSAVLDV